MGAGGAGMDLRSSLGTRRTAMAPASTKYFSDMSSIPLVVRITLAPAARIFSMRSEVMLDSRSRICSSLEGSDTSTCAAANRWSGLCSWD